MHSLKYLVTLAASSRRTIAERQGLAEQAEAGFTGQQLSRIPISSDFYPFPISSWDSLRGKPLLWCWRRLQDTLTRYGGSQRGTWPFLRICRRKQIRRKWRKWRKLLLGWENYCIFLRMSKGISEGYHSWTNVQEKLKRQSSKQFKKSNQKKCMKIPWNISYRKNI